MLACTTPALAQSASPPVPDTAQILARYGAALSRGAQPPERIESWGTLSGALLHGSVHLWHDGENERTEENLGARIDRSLQLGARRFIQNSSGNVIELHGTLLARAVTQDFIGSTALIEHPEYATLLGRATLEDGRDVYRLRVQPPGGDAETIAIDARTWLLDRLEYIEGDGPFTIDFSDYRPVAGYLFAFKQVQSDGTHMFDITQTLTGVKPGAKMPPGIFAPFVPAKLIAKQPVSVPIKEISGGIYTDVVIHGQTFSFLIDSGAQGIVLDTRTAARLALIPEGSFEARGVARTAGIGVTSLDKLHIGTATLPVGTASILDLASSTAGRFPIDGILGFPLFGASEVRIAVAHHSMTLGPPGSLPAAGTKFPIDVDRELPEVQARVNGIDGKFLVDTGNGNELLLFHPFVEANRGVIPQTLHAAMPSFGIGGSTRAYAVTIDELDLGGYRLFHRYANVILSSEGAFADRIDAGNIGLAVLRNFVFTIDAFNDALYLERGDEYDDGSHRSDIPVRIP